MTDKEGRPFTVRRLSAQDRRALEQMYSAFEPKRGAQGLPPHEPGIRRWLDRVLEKGDHFVVDIDGALLGHVMLIPTGDGKAELANFLHQSIRNRGIGTALNRMAVAAARDAGWSKVWLTVEPSNRAAVRSYQKAGFKRLAGSLWAPEMEMQADLETPAP
ncbi:MAG TPA: GNAT family N-acetyltransferase [Longimicrobiales bacterium]|nr:GNAT family N-acetyltransferase [Longimicrobiales bacterium]